MRYLDLNPWADEQLKVLIGKREICFDALKWGAIIDIHEMLANLNNDDDDDGLNSLQQFEEILKMISPKADFDYVRSNLGFNQLQTLLGNLLDFSQGLAKIEQKKKTPTKRKNKNSK